MLRNGRYEWSAACSVTGLYVALLALGYYLRPPMSGVGLALVEGHLSLMTAPTAPWPLNDHTR
jgi:hypothetical protein